MVDTSGYFVCRVMLRGNILLNIIMKMGVPLIWYSHFLWNKKQIFAYNRVSIHIEYIS